MQLLLRDYLEGRVSRRGFLERLVATGFTAAAARSVLGAAEVGAAEPVGDDKAATSFKGTGGELLVEQVRAAGTKYIFSNPGSTEVGFFDALTDRPDLQLVVARARLVAKRAPWRHPGFSATWARRFLVKTTGASTTPPPTWCETPSPSRSSCTSTVRRPCSTDRR